MKEAKYIKNSFYKTIYQDKNSAYKTGIIIFTNILYTDGSFDNFETFSIIDNNMEKCKELLSKKISNFNDFISDIDGWKKKGKYEEVNAKVKFLVPEAISSETFSFEKVTDVKVYRIVDENVDLAYIDLFNINDEINSITCKYEDVYSVLNRLLPNYNNLIKKNKVQLVNQVKNTDLVNSENHKLSEITFIIDNNDVKVYLIYTDVLNDKSFFANATLERGLEKVKKYPDIRVNYRKKNERNIIDITKDEFMKIVSTLVDKKVDIVNNKKNDENNNKNNKKNKNNNIIVYNDSQKEKESFKDKHGNDYNNLAELEDNTCDNVDLNNNLSHEENIDVSDDENLNKNKKFALCVAGISLGVLAIYGAVGLLNSANIKDVNFKNKNTSSQTDISPKKTTKSKTAIETTRVTFTDDTVPTYTTINTTDSIKTVTTSVESNESSKESNKTTEVNIITNNYNTTTTTSKVASRYTNTYKTINRDDMIPSKTVTATGTNKITNSAVPLGTVNPKDMVTASHNPKDQVFTNDGATTTKKTTTKNPYADLIVTREINNGGKTLVLKK